MLTDKLWLKICDSSDPPEALVESLTSCSTAGDIPSFIMELKFCVTIHPDASYEKPTTPGHLFLGVFKVKCKKEPCPPNFGL